MGEPGYGVEVYEVSEVRGEFESVQGVGEKQGVMLHLAKRPQNLASQLQHID